MVLCLFSPFLPISISLSLIYLSLLSVFPSLFLLHSFTLSLVWNKAVYRNPILQQRKQNLIQLLAKQNAGSQPRLDKQKSEVSSKPYLSMGARRSSEVERSLMVRWVVGSILHGVDPLSYFSFQPVLHDWCNKGRGMCYPVCGMVHIKEPLLLIDKSSLCGGSGFPFSLSEWSLTICLTPYNRR